MRVIGLISGTSVDGIDAVLTDISGSTFDLSVNVVAAATVPYPDDLRSLILSVCHNEPLSMAEIAALDDAIAHHFAQAAIQVQTGHAPAQLIGSHGQTVYHRPPGVAHVPNPYTDLGYSWQLGRGDAIAHGAYLTTVSNFRAADIAAGGQGAPLVPPVDACLLSHPKYHRCVQNIGGISNVAYLPPRPIQDTETLDTLTAYYRQVKGWDIGPGNVLLDLAVSHLSNGQQTYDCDGQWAATGRVHDVLLGQWLDHDFFKIAPPKSTGRELFGHTYLESCLADAIAHQLAPADLLATLTEVTAVAIARDYAHHLPQLPDQVLLCGGGSRNCYLRQRIQAHLPQCDVLTTEDVGIPSDFKEAIAFAVLAYWRVNDIPGNLPSATGARQPMRLGDLHHPV
jgi:anhydro-N-acetylmuramic acid kinase